MRGEKTRREVNEELESKDEIGVYLHWVYLCSSTRSRRVNQIEISRIGHIISPQCYL